MLATPGRLAGAGVRRRWDTPFIIHPPARPRVSRSTAGTGVVREGILAPAAGCVAACVSQADGRRGRRPLRCGQACPERSRGDARTTHGRCGARPLHSQLQKALQDSPHGAYTGAGAVRNRKHAAGGKRKRSLQRSVAGRRSCRAPFRPGSPTRLRATLLRSVAGPSSSTGCGSRMRRRTWARS